ncbi:MAG: hypothetical protein ABTQ32_15205, partial [Myxococcaceae bacterium]
SASVSFTRVGARVVNTGGAAETWSSIRLVTTALLHDSPSTSCCHVSEWGAESTTFSPGAR